MNWKKNFCTMLSLMLIVTLFLSMGAETVASGRKKDPYIKEARAYVTVAFNDNYVLEVKVQGGGSLCDGKQKIRKGILEYNLPVGTKKSFEIQPDKGYVLQSVHLVKPEIDPEEKTPLMDEVENGTFLVVKTPVKQVVEVNFQKAETGSVFGITPKTGDLSEIGWYVTAMLLAAAAVIGIAAKKRNKRYKRLK